MASRDLVGRRPAARRLELAGQLQRLAAHRAASPRPRRDLVEHPHDAPAQLLAGDPRRARARPRRAAPTRRSRSGSASSGSSTSSSRPRPSRRTRITGWMTRWIAIAGRAELHRHRVDQERHVVGDDLDHRVRRVPAVAARSRGCRPAPWLRRRALAGQVPVGQRGAVQIERVPSGEILVRHPAVQLADEGLAGAASPSASRSRTRAQMVSISSASSCACFTDTRTPPSSSRQLPA